MGLSSNIPSYYSKSNHIQQRLSLKKKGKMTSFLDEVF